MPALATSRRPSGWEWALVLLVVANLAWTTLCLGGYRPETMIVTSAVNAALLIVHLLSRTGSSRERRPLHIAGWCLLPFLMYAAANVVGVSPVRWLGWRDWFGWAQMILVFWVVLNGIRSTPGRATLLSALLAIAGITVALAFYQRFVAPTWLMMGRTQVEQFIGRSSGSFGIPNSLGALLLLVIPVAGALAFQRSLGGILRLALAVLTVFFLLGLGLTISRGAYLALAGVLMTWPLFAARGSVLRRLAWAAAAVTAVVAVCAVIWFAVPEVRERFVQMKNDAGEKTRPIMWRGAWQIFREHPVLGSGAGSYSVVFEKFRPMKYQDQPVWAHNDYLNTLSDYGAVGFGLFFGVAAILTWATLRRRERRSRDALDNARVSGAMVAGIVAFALQLFVDFHFKIPALAMAFAIMAALVVQRYWPERRLPHRAPPVVRVLFGVAALAVAIGAVVFVQPYYRSEALRYAARQSVDRMASDRPDVAGQRKILGEARALLARSVEINPANAQAWADLSYATSLWARVEPGRTAELGRTASDAAERALALSFVVPEFWARRGVAFDMAGRRAEAGEAFVQAITLAPANGQMWYYQAYHLAGSKADASLALAAVEFSLRLDPGNGEAQLLRQRLTSGRRGF